VAKPTALIQVQSSQSLFPQRFEPYTPVLCARRDKTVARPVIHQGACFEHAAAASDVTGDILRAPVHKKLDGEGEPHDDLCLIKGVGPKFAEALRGAGFVRFEQIAHLTPTEIERLDARLGTFAGRINRDRIVEQSDYLARNDTDGFEQKFGKL